MKYLLNALNHIQKPEMIFKNINMYYKRIKSHKKWRDLQKYEKCIKTYEHA